MQVGKLVEDVDQALHVLSSRRVDRVNLCGIGVGGGRRGLASTAEREGLS
jgi:hypothetical protein